MKGEGGDVMVCVSERGEGGEELAQQVGVGDKSFYLDNNNKELAQQEDSAWADMLEGSDYPELFSPGGCIKKDCSALSPRISHQVSILLKTLRLLNHPHQGPAMSPRGPASVQQEIFCRAKFVRRQGLITKSPHPLQCLFLHLGLWRWTTS